MNATASDWGTLWERRLFNELDDRFADILMQQLHLRVRSFDSVSERVIGLRTVELEEGFAFLSLVGDSSGLLLRLAGPTGQQGDALRSIVVDLERAVGRANAQAELARYPGPSLVGSPVWVPLLASETSTVTQFLRSNWPAPWSDLTWPSTLPDLYREAGHRAPSCLGIVVSSLVESISTAIEAGGVLLSQTWEVNASAVVDDPAWLHPTDEGSKCALVEDPAHHPLLLWQLPHNMHVMPARVDFATDQIDHMAEFYHRVAGWETQVLPKDGKINALLTHADQPVGILREGPAEGQRLFLLIDHPSDTVWKAWKESELTVGSLRQRPLLGRQWRINDADGNEVFLRGDIEVGPPAIRWTPWAYLPEPFRSAFDDLELSLDFLEEAQWQNHQLPPKEEQVDTLLTVLEDAVIPAARTCAMHLRPFSPDNPIFEALSELRTLVTLLLPPLALTVQSLHDDALSAVFAMARRDLVRAHLLPERTDELQGQHVSA
ncbi:hypothetical protein OG381_48125 [Streptomyces sp. NBC_00490]|uniref:hypothetical protein n=1 Tax=Streptomyces sp. NBC_00490 TaxID=2903657 RepID=UPI002E1773C5